MPAFHKIVYGIRSLASIIRRKYLQQYMGIYPTS